MPASFPARHGVPAFAKSLRADFAGDIRADPYTLHLYSSDASMYAIEPLAVAYPKSADDVAAAVARACEHGVPVIARGAGTSLAGQTVGRGLILDFSRHMRRITRLDPEARTAHVEPGVVQDQLNRAAGAHGLMFGADTSTSNRATLGGMIGNNSSGTHSVIHGTTADHVRALDVVLADSTRARLEALSAEERMRRAQAPTLEGLLYRELPRIADVRRDAILNRYPRHWRQSGGYRLDRLIRREPSLDLAEFLVGSEGTLALVTGAEVALLPRPAAQAMAVGHFESTRTAIAATSDALTLSAAAVELMDRTILELSRQKREYSALSGTLIGDPAALLFVTFFGATEHEAASQVERLTNLWREHRHGYYTLRAVSSSDRAAVLKVRAASLGLLMAASRGRRRPLAFIEDTAVEPSRLEEYVLRVEQILDRHGMHAGFYGHCSVGCLHIRPFVDLTRSAEVGAMRAVAEEVLELVIEFGGVNSSEHGDGAARSEFNPRLFGPELYEGMCEVKRLFDPDDVLNPGKIVDAEPMTAHLRDPVLPTPVTLTTRLRFPEGDMYGAADRCMNIGLCRKTSTGTMCPSYQVTLEERHSTRGRANALVKALSASDPATALADPALHEILDLCLGCKACSSECPLSVDMASLKNESLARYYDVHGVPLRARMFGRIRALNRAGAAAAPLSNPLARSKLLRTWFERAFGITASRPLPRFERPTLMSWYRKHRRVGSASAGEVVFLADSFTSFTETRVPRAAIELLERAGWYVTLDSRGCCGRSSLSSGRIDQARAMARGTVQRLAPHAERGVPITGCEPSCLLTLRDEYLDLLPDDPSAEAVARQTKPLAELLLEAIADRRLDIPDGSLFDGRRVVLHAHCHEKAVTGSGATLELLRQIPGVDVTELDAGCCGMAGSFGFESGHYDVSLQIAKLRLAPALRDAGPDAIVAATGVSCRQQIAHVAGRKVWHPVELLQQAFDQPPVVQDKL